MCRTPESGVPDIEQLYIGLGKPAKMVHLHWEVKILNAKRYIYHKYVPILYHPSFMGTRPAQGVIVSDGPNVVSFNLGGVVSPRRTTVRLSRL